MDAFKGQRSQVHNELACHKDCRYDFNDAGVDGLAETDGGRKAGSPRRSDRHLVIPTYLTQPYNSQSGSVWQAIVCIECLHSTVLGVLEHAVWSQRVRVVLAF